MKTILFIDGRNFLGKLKEVCQTEKLDFSAWDTYDFRGLIDHVLNGFSIERRVFYLARLRVHEATEVKSRQLVEEQRLLKTRLEGQGFEVLITGAVRGHLAKNQQGREILVFKEKGVDVSIAVDMVTFSYEGKLDTAIIGSSDSDLQPAVRALKARGTSTVYLGFENMPNKGLTATTNRTILIRNREVIQFLPRTLLDAA